MADDRSNPKNWLGSYADADTGWVALRAAERPAYLASALAEFVELREWTPEQLAQWLRCAPSQLAKLGLCRRPDPASLEFREQVAQIVTQFQLDYWNLHRLLEDLSLPAEQRRRLWQTQDLVGQPRPSETLAGRRPGSIPRTHRVTMSAGMDSAAAAAQGPLSEKTPQSPAEVRPQAALPASVPAAKPTWLARLRWAIRNFFTRK